MDSRDETETRKELLEGGEEEDDDDNDDAEEGEWSQAKRLTLGKSRREEEKGAGEGEEEADVGAERFPMKRPRLKRSRQGEEGEVVVVAVVAEKLYLVKSKKKSKWNGKEAICGSIRKKQKRDCIFWAAGEEKKGNWEENNKKEWRLNGLVDKGAEMVVKGCKKEQKRDGMFWAVGDEKEEGTSRQKASCGQRFPCPASWML